MTKHLFIATAILCCVVSHAQTLDESLMNSLRSSWQDTPTNRALVNAITQCRISDLTLSQDSHSEADMTFTYEVPSNGIKNQKSSGRCWLFTGMTVLQNLSTTGGTATAKDASFSHVYISFHDLLEKANLFCQTIIDTRQTKIGDRRLDWLLHNPINEGGTFTGVADMVEKYGLVPASVMLETNQSESSGQMLRLITTVLRRAVPELRKNPAHKEKVLKDVYRILVLCCG